MGLTVMDIIDHHNGAMIEDQGKSTETFRVYEEMSDDPIQMRVKQFYYDQHRNQTLDFVTRKREEWLQFSHASLNIMDCLQILSDFLDASDPDVDVPNLVHAYQTAERLRQAVPDKPWMHLVGLIHDLGKVMAMWGEEQYATAGDTYPVGCAPAKSIVYSRKSFDGNPDMDHPVYSTTNGIYQPGCGLENLIMAWGHDEYTYQALVNHPTCALPDEALYAIRFHSFYPYHTGRDYLQFVNERDR